MKKIELERIIDLAYLASSAHSGILQHFQDESGNNIYYLIGGTISDTLIFYVIEKEMVKKRFISFDPIKNKIEYTNTPIIDPKIKIIPIVEVKRQNLVDFI